MAAKKEIEYRFLLVGKSGSGKSSTANNIMGEYLFPVSTGLSSGTKFCEGRRSSRPQKGVTFRIVDTPGLFDPKKSNEEIKEEIIKACAYLHPGLHAILYVLKVDRYTPEERETFNHLKSLFDSNAVKYVIIIFTGRDELKKKKISVETLLEQADEPFQEVLRECSNRVLVFNNAKRDPKQTKELLKMVDKIWKENGEGPYTCPLQNHVNVKLERRATVRAQERIEKDPALKVVFDELGEQYRNATKESEDQRKRLEDSTYRKEMAEKMLAEKKAAKEMEDQKLKEREREEKEKQEKAEKEKRELEEKNKREEEERELKRKEEKKAEEEKARKENEKEIEELRKKLDQIKKEDEINQRLKKEKQKMEEEFQKKLEEEKKKYEKEELEKTKQDIVKGEENQWIRDVVGVAAGGVLKAAKGLLRMW